MLTKGISHNSNTFIQTCILKSCSCNITLADTCMNENRFCYNIFWVEQILNPYYGKGGRKEGWQRLRKKKRGNTFCAKEGEGLILTINYYFVYLFFNIFFVSFLIFS